MAACGPSRRGRVLLAALGLPVAAAGCADDQDADGRATIGVLDPPDAATADRGAAAAEGEPFPFSRQANVLACGEVERIVGRPLFRLEEAPAGLKPYCYAENFATAGAPKALPPVGEAVSAGVLYAASPDADPDEILDAGGVLVAVRVGVPDEAADEKVFVTWYEEGGPGTKVRYHLVAGAAPDEALAMARQLERGAAPPGGG